MMDVPSNLAALMPWISTVGLLVGSSLFIAHLEACHVYDNIWMLTVCSLHAAPIVTMRVVLQEEAVPWVWCLCLGWSILSLRSRRWNRSLFSASFVAMEISLAIAVDPASSFVCAFMLLQPAIVVSFWFFIVLAAVSRRFTFLKLDLHLRRGVRHVWHSREALACVRTELVGHLLLQALCGASLWPYTSQVSAAAFCDVALFGLAYVLAVLAAAAVLPPHKLPYGLGQLPPQLRLRPRPAAAPASTSYQLLNT